jgi:hypothetical protein
MTTMMQMLYTREVSRYRAMRVNSFVALLMLVLCVPMFTGCTPAQQQTTLQIVTAINGKIPEIVAGADTVAATIEMLAPSDAALIATCDVGFDTLAKSLQAMTAAYIANPSATTLQQIQSALNALIGSITTATLNVDGIKDPESLRLAKAALSQFSTAVTFAFALIAPTESHAALLELQRTHAIQVAVLRRNLDEPKLRRDLAAQGVDLDRAMAQAEAAGF